LLDSAAPRCLVSRSPGLPRLHLLTLVDQRGEPTAWTMNPYCERRLAQSQNAQRCRVNPSQDTSISASRSTSRSLANEAAPGRPESPSSTAVARRRIPQLG
jgi:hypothetical protein